MYVNNKVQVSALLFLLQLLTNISSKDEMTAEYNM